MILYVVRNKVTRKYLGRTNDHPVDFEKAQFYSAKNPATARKNWQTHSEYFEVIAIPVSEPE